MSDGGTGGARTTAYQQGQDESSDLRMRLVNRKLLLESQLANVNKALKALDDNPALEGMVRVLSQAFM